MKIKSIPSRSILDHNTIIQIIIISNKAVLSNNTQKRSGKREILIPRPAKRFVNLAVDCISNFLELFQTTSFSFTSRFSKDCLNCFT